MVMRISAPGDAGLLMTFRPLSKLQLMKPLTEYNQKVVRMRQRGLIYPYEIIKMLTPDRENTRADFPHGDFVEYDLESKRPPGTGRSSARTKSNPTSSSALFATSPPSIPRA